eukprot:PITA_25817
MGSSLKANAVRDLLKSEQPDFLLLQETKITEQEFKDSMKKNKNYEGLSISAVGASGGIGTIWNKKKWQLKDYRQNRWWIRTDIQNTTKTEEYSIYNVYAPPHFREKASCWESISSDLRTAQGKNIFLGGDLNLIRNSQEKLGGNFFADPLRDGLEEIIQTHKLIDTPPQNGKYIWSNKRTGKNNIKERLDRILAQDKILANFQRIQSSIIQGYFSDHKPVALRLDKGNYPGPIPFKYNKEWDSNEGFRELIKDQWAMDIMGSPHFIWETKIKSLRTAIKQITVEGRVFSDQEEIKDAASRHFQSLLTADPNYLENPEFLSIVRNQISENQSADLDKEITTEEIEWSILSMPPDKAPGPDGFIVAFYKTHWEIIKKDYIRMEKNFFSKCKMGSNIKSTHLALIPKDTNPQSFDRFRPISLCNVSYKIITKILANRLKTILPSIISENQGGFVPRRHITDNVILIQEAIHNSISRNEKGMIIKLDMANAFDRVNHSFLKAVMRKFGIFEHFTSRVIECISDIWTAPLINGRPCSTFKSSRGLRQGCPLSPFLFIIMGETLSLHLENKRRLKEITGIDIVRGAKGINHSLFADDTLLIGGASSLMARRFKKTLDLFLQASGGKLNNSKCMIYTWNVPIHITQIISLIMEIPAQGNWSYFKYLGLPLAKDNVKSEIWVKLIEKMRGKLQS